MFIPEICTLDVSKVDVSYPAFWGETSAIQVVIGCQRGGREGGREVRGVAERWQGSGRHRLRWGIANTNKHKYRKTQTIREVADTDSDERLLQTNTNSHLTHTCKHSLFRQKLFMERMCHYGSAQTIFWSDQTRPWYQTVAFCESLLQPVAVCGSHFPTLAKTILRRRIQL